MQKIWEVKKYAKNQTKQPAIQIPRFQTVNILAYSLSIYFYALKFYNTQIANIYWVLKICTLQVLSILYSPCHLILRSPSEVNMFY